MALTGLTNLQPLHVHSIGINTFDGAVSVGGTLTYEDVTNVDSLGIGTFRTGVKVLAGGINAVGVITATSYRGDGSQLTGISGVTINNNANNRVITGSGTAATLEGESNLTYDGTTLQVQSSGSGLRELLRLKNSNASAGVSGLYFNSTTSGSAFDAACVRNGVNGSCLLYTSPSPRD